MMSFKDDWKKELNEGGFKFFVVKIDDLFWALDEKWLAGFNEILKKYNEYRELRKGKPVNKYWVVNRDEPYADEVKKMIEEGEGIKL